MRMSGFKKLDDDIFYQIRDEIIFPLELINSFQKNFWT